MFIGMGFALNPYQIRMPAAVENEHYMLTAKLPANSSKEEFQGMMQRLLKERFGLSYRLPDRKMGGYSLKVARAGPKLRPVDANVESDAEMSGQGHPGPIDLKIGEDGFPVLPEGLGLSLVSIKENTRLKSNRETPERPL